MKTTRSLLLVAALSPAAFLLSSCAKTNAELPVVQDAKAVTKETVAEVATAVDSWESVKDFSYEKREAFASALERLSAKLETEIHEISTKAAGETATDATKQRAAAVKGFTEANISLKSQLMSLRSGTADTWDSAKAKVIQAWNDEQAGYAKVKASPAS